MKSEDYLREIRKRENLARAVLKKIVVEGDTAEFRLVTDRTYTKEDCAYADEVSRRFVPEGMKGKASVTKSVPSAEGVRKAILDILRSRFPSAAAFVSPEDAEVSPSEGGGRFFLTVGETDGRLFSEEEVLDGLSEELGREFCGVWTGEFRHAQREAGEIEREDAAPAEYLFAPRFFPVEGYVAVDGAAPERAIYIADLDREFPEISVCGTVTSIEEKVSKNNRPYFSIALADGSGSMRVTYFPKQATADKVRAVQRGDSVCLTGQNELYQGSLSFRARKLDYGAPPAGYVFEMRPSRPVPARYSCVFPTPISDFVQGDFFGTAVLPQDLVARDFVVFDLETTGLTATPAAGIMDRIIEIGAVKVVKGSIAERFSTFVACPVKLSEEIVKLTGITDEMLVGAPPIESAIADFYKFCDGCALAGHNVAGFDMKFIRHYGEKEGYLFDHPVYDTLSFSQEELRLPNYKLNTIADYFGFTFNHHRAFDDAFVTAKIFIELCRRKGGLPRA